LPVNVLLGLNIIVILLLLLLALQCVLYFYSRIKKKYSIVLICYAAVSYLALIISYIFNVGSLGPTISVFFLTFQMLIAFTSNRLHKYWFILHLIIPVSLLLSEFFDPNFISNIYSGRTNRLADLLSSYILIIACMYWITRYLRNNYKQEKERAEKRLQQIEQQRDEIIKKNEELDQLNAQKIKLLSIVSHDLRTPLANTVNLVNMLNESGLSEKERLFLVEELNILSGKSMDMLNNLLAWSTSQMQGIHVKTSEVDIRQLVSTLVSEQAVPSSKKQINIDNRLSDGLLIITDADIIGLILRNLIQNAIKFTAKGGWVTIYDKITPVYYEISIQDNGVGMSEEQLANIFTSGAVSTYGTGNERGMGIGLRLCQEFVDMLAGKIHVDSVEGRGTTFHVFIPFKTTEVVNKQ
jgi:two-component system, sensor histidine kinase and response regulator